MSAVTGATTSADGPPSGGRDGPVDFFISHASSDSDWAEWVAATVQDAGYSVELDVWHWTAGTGFVESMNAALNRAGRVLALASPDYFARTWTKAEMNAAFVQQAKEEGFLVPVLIRACTEDEYPPLLKPLIRIELAGLDETTARARLLGQLAGRRHRPAGITFPFPGPAVPPGLARGGVGPPAVFPGRLPPVWGPVPARNLFFTGRDNLLADLHNRLTAGPGRMTVATLQGFGGVGKTQLAIEYAWRYAADLDAVWWVDAETLTSLTSGLAGLATALSVGAGTEPERASAALAELGRRRNWLLIYDNAIDPTAIAGLLPPRSGRLIVTCRDESLRRVVGDLLGVAEFTRDESIALLRHHVPDLSDTAADQLAEALGDLPLAVDQAGAFLATTGMNVHTYLALLADQPQVLLADDTPRHLGLAKTVSAAYTQLATENPFAAALLDQLALLAPEPIPLAAIPTGDVQPVRGALLVAGPLATHTALAAISRYALARRTGTNLQMHRLVEALVRVLAYDRTHQILEATLGLLGTADPGDPTNPEAWPAYASLAPHIVAAAARVPATGEVSEPPPFRSLFLRTCRYLDRAGQSRDAHALAETARARWAVNLGTDHPDRLILVNILAITAISLGKFAEARTLAADAWRRQLQILGADHVATLNSANTLVVAMIFLGDYESARALAEDTFDRRRQLLGDDNPETLTSAGNFAMVLGQLGERGAARTLAEDTLARRRRVLGNDHQETLSSAATLSVQLAELGEYEAARSLAEDTWERRRRVLGSDHPETLVSAASVAVLLAELGEYEAARSLAEDTWWRRRQVLGDDHRDTLRSATNLAIELATPGERQRALALAEDALARFRLLLGDENSDTRLCENVVQWLKTATLVD
ncbi:Tetratricopeptide TPR_4 [Parafrankia sp. Ea1.12]|uniref:FxSxx-COOH system tetratricopeptide repeat protein n=1 Tax=Parafrankia sp. Ea1.12 TaxID=573499 RepID=UPI000DA577D3|nr:FxSxx-COOH system tetratricopeptide repeat protein [Parafrankia sp. Ea1.12]SQE00263.1 Tetratricopeptide TPR_4 [Parafrankia sp. Ea1.12]